MLVSTYRVSRQYLYSYIHVRPIGTKPHRYVLFLHGWPSLASEWHHQIEYFSRLGYGIIVPDLLGYGNTDAPADVNAYKMRLMAEDIIEILDHEAVDSVYGVGHDFGVHLLSRLAFYFPERLTKICFLAVGYYPLGQLFDVEAMNQMTAMNLGYSAFGYMKWFNESPEAPSIMDQHQASLLSILFPADPAIWKIHFGPEGGLEAWLKNDSRTIVGAYINDNEQKLRNEMFGGNRGYGPTLNWYKVLLRNMNYPDEQGISLDDQHLRQPVLLLTCKKDPIAISEAQVQATQPFAACLSTRELDTGHWMQLEAPEVVNQALQEFFDNYTL
ncbi:Bifunctional epoxide hydrolase 2 [Trichoderma lentiforme]|uniref:Bifunctional epoxide hydrolase 2 n=1 Tax=Trichoderma lentiforme TaxID=1567552 RepID=A0A9P4X459_9HYPO|nr:Bifunctional epoxide hydrolase 2 [Trichoderma lentiforme]